MTETELICEFMQEMHDLAHAKGYSNKTIFNGLLGYIAGYTAKMSPEKKAGILMTLAGLENKLREASGK